ncbi:MAG: phage shock protein A [Oceanospirillaceae bacterium]|uniref:PspA/IM30 family protein n=1 Tax=unclassified Thalassolituus TaxID=2624967 RepID=UPI000C6111E0|nr:MULTISPECIES: PspA/IM30 family protein [unclassified Thalassolituus]MAS24163.1 phage shock protein A [Oceanospirillaceae bacterium]MAX99676.1 phage shock protein A [Oceanospirillaceae bacterium]MBL35425.1 phage shock protein A [Oceanospirillaceae bacterium]MBS51892.1 phage shock protein A [Oceanospirillaceae bacterium]|tara:strand:+ start:408 stop:1097 length:690 start_codon:yes stop_codon:yes gene_type:complete
MNIWAKMMTALRGGVNEAGEAIVDSQALRILDQEVRDAASELNQSKNALAEIMARHKLAEQKCKTLQQQIEEHEGYALKALEKGDEGLAREVAEKIAGFESLLSTEQEAETGYSASVAKLKTAIMQTEANIKRLKQQVDTVKATENVQRAQAAVAARHSGSSSKLHTAMESLERIKEKQALRDAQMTAASELAEESQDVSLQTKLEQAGIAIKGSSTDDILQRIKSKKQ